MEMPDWPQLKQGAVGDEAIHFAFLNYMMIVVVGAGFGRLYMVVVGAFAGFGLLLACVVLLPGGFEWFEKFYFLTLNLDLVLEFFYTGCNWERRNND